jgi:hypothetical protein
VLVSVFKTLDWQDWLKPVKILPLQGAGDLNAEMPRVPSMLLLLRFL